jgi:hypothetical protein
MENPGIVLYIIQYCLFCTVVMDEKASRDHTLPKCCEAATYIPVKSLPTPLSVKLISTPVKSLPTPVKSPSTPVNLLANPVKLLPIPVKPFAPPVKTKLIM